MKTTAWGPAGWVFLHCIAANYPENPAAKDMCNAKLFFAQAENVLPCKYCRQSYRGYIRELPIDDFLDSRESLSYWLYLIHNKVNDKLRSQGYPVENDPTFMEVCAKYESMRAGCGKTKGKGPSCRLPLKAKEHQRNLKRFQQREQKLGVKPNMRE